jgi:hypothetical protein
MTQEALKLALDALETELSIDWTNNDEFNESAKKMYEAIAAIKEALAQEQEPVAWVCMNNKKHDIDFDQPEIDAMPVGTMLYTHPQRTWVGLEGEEIRNLWEEVTKPDRSTMTMVTSFARATEAKLKEKNT